MSFSLLKNVFPNFGEGGKIQQTFLEHNYQQILEKEDAHNKTSIVSYEKEIGSPVDLPKKITKPLQSIERFEEEGHESYQQRYLKHLMTCEECKKLLVRQLDTKPQSNVNLDETIIEMGMYVLFGVFILALLDTK